MSSSDSSNISSRKKHNLPMLLLIKHKGIVATFSIIGLILLYDLVPLGGNIRFYSKWLECGQKPVGTNLEWNFGGGTPPNYGVPPTFSLMRLSPDYFCTPLEAEQAGFSASSSRYEFPNLKSD